MSAHYFLDNKYLGDAPIAWWDSARREEFSKALFCPICGTVWGRVVLDHAPGWIAMNSGCPRHPYPHADEPGGSFIPPWPIPLESLPLPVLQREVLIHYEHQRPKEHHG